MFTGGTIWLLTHSQTPGVGELQPRPAAPGAGEGLPPAARGSSPRPRRQRSCGGRGGGGGLHQGAELVETPFRRLKVNARRVHPKAWKEVVAQDAQV